MHVDWDWTPGMEEEEAPVMNPQHDLSARLEEIFNFILANPFISFEEVQTAVGGDFAGLKNELQDLERKGCITSRSEYGTSYYFPIQRAGEEKAEDASALFPDDFDPYSADLGIPRKEKAKKAPTVEWESPANVEWDDFEEQVKSQERVEWIDWEEGLNIDELYIVTKKMELMRHFRYAGGEGLDENALGTMLTVIQSFVNDSFSTGGMPIKELVFDDSLLQVVPGKHLNIVAISTNADPEELNQPLEELLEEIEEINADILEDFDGDPENLRGIQEAVKKLAID